MSRIVFPPVEDTFLGNNQDELCHRIFSILGENREKSHNVSITNTCAQDASQIVFVSAPVFISAFASVFGSIFGPAFDLSCHFIFIWLFC